MKKQLKRIYHRVGRETFIRGMQNAWRLAVFVLLLAALGGIAACARKDNSDAYCIYEITTEQLVFETSPENNRLKVPVIKTVKYWVKEKK